MDIEKLTKSQIILLTLLVSFVTSIATGIVTVSLMDQAPPIISQTINRVIERTIQTVASTTPKGQTAATIVTQEKTVVVRESDLISQAIEKISPSIVRFYDTSKESPTFLGFGVILSPGTIVSDTDAFGEGADAVAELADGTRLRAFVSARDSATGVAYLSTATTTSEGTAIAMKSVAVSTAHPQLGQSVILRTGKSTARIAPGVVTMLAPLSSEKNSPQVIDTDISANSIYPGAPLIDIDGSLIGVSTGVSRASTPSGFLVASVLMKTPEKK